MRNLLRRLLEQTFNAQVPDITLVNQIRRVSLNEYYQTNDVYRRLEGAGLSPPLIWCSGNAWIVAYADTNQESRLIAYITGRSVANAKESERKRLHRASVASSLLADSAGIPWAEISFDDQIDEIDSVQLNDSSVKLPELKRWFANIGLATMPGTTPSKAINDRSSSAYHNWQRSSLGNITVTDVDLIKVVRRKPQISAIYELKRSGQPLNSWRPYVEDFPNFDILSKLAETANAEFKIVYNVLTSGKQRIDRADSLKVFNYSHLNQSYQEIGIWSFDDFIRGEIR